MVEYINVDGDIDEVKGSINYYSVTIIQDMKSIDELRKGYLNQFLQDFRRVNKIINRKINDNNTNVNTGVVLDKFKSGEHKGFCEVEYASKGIVLDEYLDEESEIESDVQSDKQVEDIVYVSNGIILEDYLGEDDSQNSDFDKPIFDEITDTNSDSNSTVFDFDKPFFTDDIEYVGHGVILEDYLDESYETEDSEYQEVGYNEYSEEESEYYSDEYEEFIEDDEYSEEESEYYSDEHEEFIEDDKLSTQDSSGYSESLDGNESNKLIEDTVATKVKVSIGNSDNLSISYKNVRDYVKKNPGCLIADVKEFFSIKEIQKALMTSKIVEKRNRLYVV